MGKELTATEMFAVDRVVKIYTDQMPPSSDNDKKTKVAAPKIDGLLSTDELDTFIKIIDQQKSLFENTKDCDSCTKVLDLHNRAIALRKLMGDSKASFLYWTGIVNDKKKIISGIRNSDLSSIILADRNGDKRTSIDELVEHRLELGMVCIQAIAIDPESGLMAVITTCEFDKSDGKVLELDAALKSFDQSTYMSTIKNFDAKYGEDSKDKSPGNESPLGPGRLHAPSRRGIIKI